MKKNLVLLLICSILFVACQAESVDHSREFRPTLRYIVEKLPDYRILESIQEYTDFCAPPNVNKDVFSSENNVGSICLWIHVENSSNKITHISIYYYRFGPTLLELVNRYGYPDKIAWTGWAFNRYLVWTGQGVIALISYAKNSNYSNASVILYFEPMSLDMFSAEYPSWPWNFAPTFISEENMYKKGQRGIWDNLPQDPFDWKSLTPTPSNK